jgi:hypothetical protein
VSGRFASACFSLSPPTISALGRLAREPIHSRESSNITLQRQVLVGVLSLEVEKRMSRIICLSVVLLVAISSAVAQDVRYNFDKTEDFSKLKTYKWVLIKGAQTPNDIVDKQVKSSIDAQLAAKGLSKMDSDQADIFLGYQTAIGQDKQFTSYSTDWGYGGGWYRGGWYGGIGGSSMTTGQTSTIYTGQLAVDMYDSTNHTLIWRGVASKTLDPKAKPEKQEKNLDKAVAKLFKNYPPKAKT